MASVADLEAALINAGRAGDEKAARRIAAEIVRVKQGPSVMDVPAGARMEAANTPAWMAPVLGAGKQGERWVEGIKQPFLAAAGRGDEQAARVEESDAAYKALQDRHPWLTLGGEIAATAAGATPIGMALLAGLEYGSPSERLGRAGINYAGGKLGEWAGKGLAKLKGPASMSTTPVGAADDAATAGVTQAAGPAPSQSGAWEQFFSEPAAQGNKWGIPLTKGQAEQTRTQQIVESVLENMPLSSGPMLRARDKTFTGFNRAVGKEIGAEGANRLTPDVLGSAADRAGKAIGEIAERNRITFDEGLMAALEQVEQRIAKELVGSERKLAMRQIKEIYKAIDPATDQIPGSTYKALQSAMGRIGQERGGAVSGVMHEARAALRDAMTRSVSPDDAKAWLKANEQYFNAQQVAKAIKSDASGNMSPRQLLTQVNQAQKQAKFGGGNDLAELSQWASIYLPDKIPNSGTAQRQFWQNMMSKPLTTAAALGGGAFGLNQTVGDVDPEAYAGLAIPYALARGRAGKPASALARALLARGGAATGAVAAERMVSPNALAAMLRQRGEGDEQ